MTPNDRTEPGMCPHLRNTDHNPLYCEHCTGQQPAQLLAKHQPCGCIVCTCADDVRCHGCGAWHCGTHPVSEIPNAVYEQPAQPGSGEVKRYVGRITELEPSPVQHVVLASDYDRLQSALEAAQRNYEEGLSAWRANNAYHAAVIDRLQDVIFSRLCFCGAGMNPLGQHAKDCEAREAVTRARDP